MQCNSCRAEFPTNVTYCPACGNLIASSVQPSDQSTVMSSPGVSQPQPVYPPTNYGSPPYEVLQQNLYSNPYEPPSPYGAGLPQPPTPVIGNGTLPPVPPVPPVPSPIPSPRPNRTRLFLIIGISMLALILIAGSVNLFMSSRGKRGSETNAMPAYLPYKGTLALDDPLQDNSKGYSWQETSDRYGESCSFTKRAYHAIAQKSSGETAGFLYTCAAESASFDNFVFQVQMNIMQVDCGALVFRASPSNFQFYYFRVCVDGYYTLFTYKNAQDVPPPSVGPLSSTSIHTGLNRYNLIAVVAKGNTIDFYANQKKIDSVTDSTYSKGEIALAAEVQTSDLTEVAYSNAKVWEL